MYLVLSTNVFGGINKVDDVAVFNTADKADLDAEFSGNIDLIA